MFTLGGYQCYDPRQLKRELDGLHVPTGAWFGMANCFQNPLGGKPGLGFLLMRRGDLDELEPGEGNDTFLELVVFDHQNEQTFPKILIVGSGECLSCGDPHAPNSIYMVPIADIRWLNYQRGETVADAYNVRSPDSGSYYEGTLHGPNDPWTWQEMIDDLWPVPLGLAPTLPFTPHGTPENFWYHGISRLEAIDHVLTRLCCALKYDPIEDEFTIVRLGDEDSQTATDGDTLITQWTDDGYLLWHDYPVTTRTTQLPETVRVEFVVKQTYCDGAAPYTTMDSTVTPTPGPVAAGTIVHLQDDLTARSDNGGADLTNGSDMTTRGDERRDDFVRKRQFYDRDDVLTFSGALPLVDAVGSLYYAVTWFDVGGTRYEHSGAKTEIRSGRIYDDQFDVTKWKRPIPTYEGLPIDCGAENCTEFAVRCQDGQLLTRYMRGHFTVSDVPCMGLGGGPLGGPPMGEGGPPPPIPGPMPGGGGGGGGVPPPLPGPGGESGGGTGGGPVCPHGYYWNGFECVVLCPAGTYWGYSISYGGWACIPYTGYGGGMTWGGTGGVGVSGTIGPRSGLTGNSMGGGRPMGGVDVYDPFPAGTSPQVVGYDANGNLTATTVTSSLGTTSPAALTASVDNYAPTAAGLLLLTTDGGGPYNVTGLSMSQVDGQEVVIINDHAMDSIVFKMASGSSSAANRFSNGSDVSDITLAPGGRSWWKYTSATTSWRYLGNLS